MYQDLPEGKSYRQISQQRRGKPPVKVLFIEDTPSGIDVDMVFPAGRHYRKSISWNSIYCGVVSVRTVNGQVVAKKIPKKGEWNGEEEYI